jgi:hypothetical protein
VMNQMAPAEGWELVAVEKPMQPVAGKFRDDDRVHQRRDDSDECDVQAFVNHGRFSLHFFPAAPEAKQDAVVEMTLRSANGLFKRQGTPSGCIGEMSHYVVGGCFLAG